MGGDGPFLVSWSQAGVIRPSGRALPMRCTDPCTRRRGSAGRLLRSPGLRGRTLARGAGSPAHECRCHTVGRLLAPSGVGRSIPVPPKQTLFFRREARRRPSSTGRAMRVRLILGWDEIQCDLALFDSDPPRAACPHPETHLLSCSQYGWCRVATDNQRDREEL